MHVAYLSSRIYFPLPGLGQAGIERDRFFPVFALACPPFLASSSRPLRTRNRAIGAVRAQHGLHRYVSPPLSHPYTHTHSLSLSLSPSLSGSGITTTHTAPRPAQRAFSFRGRRSVYLIISHFRTRARTPTPQYNGAAGMGGARHLCIWIR